MIIYRIIKSIFFQRHSLYIGISLIALCCALNANAQSAEEIIAKHIEARGGEAAWKKVESLKYSGTFTGFSIPKPFTTIKKRPNLYRSDFVLSKFNVVLVNNETSGWTIDPWFDVPFARLLNHSEQQVVEQKAEFGSPFLNYKEKGYEVTYLGVVEIDGVNAHKLELKKPQQVKETWYLDSESYLEFKQESVWDDFGSPQMQESYFDDFRKVDGITIPFYTERAYGIRNRITEVATVDINPEIPAHYFDFPVSEKIQDLQFMVGAWSLVIEAPSRRGISKKDSVSCNITLSGNKLSTQVDYNNYFRFVKDLSWTYHSKTNAYRLAIYNQFSGQMELFAGEMNQDTIKYSPIDAETKQKQFHWIKSSENQFVLERKKVSSNNKNGQLLERLIFTKIE